MSVYEADTISEFIHHIRLSTRSDFAALALLSQDGRRYRWQYTSGNQNDRYKQMVVRKGKGLAGMAVLLGRTLTIDSQSDLSIKLDMDSPLMMAEGLQAAAAIPVREAVGDHGVLVIGIRRTYCYSENELREFQGFADDLANMLTTTRMNAQGNK